jgi:serine/threonine protein kinase
MLEIKNLIGKGSTAEVYECEYKGEKYAAKILNINKKINLLDFIIMKFFTNEHINNGLEFIFNDEEIIILQKKFYNLKKYRKEIQIENIIGQLIKTLYILNHNNIIHGDLKMENLLLDENKNLILSDFSSSTYYSSKNKTYLSGTQTHIPIEKSWNEKFDVWSLGCTIYELKYGHSLFPPQINGEIKRHKNSILDWFYSFHDEVKNEYRYNSISYIKPQLSKKFIESNDVIDELIKDCLTVEDYKRPTIKEIYKKYKNNFNMEDINLIKYDIYTDNIKLTEFINKKLKNEIPTMLFNDLDYELKKSFIEMLN